MSAGLFHDSTLWWSICVTGAAAIAAAAYVLFGPEGNRERVPRCPGLVNFGNTCFVNAILQALSSSSSVLEWLTYNQQCGSLAKSLHDLIQALNDSEELSISPVELLNALKWHGWVIDYQQQDALELYHVLLTTLEEEMAGPTSSLSDIVKLVSLEYNVKGVAKTKIGSFNAPPRSRPCPMRGLLTSTLVCCDCRHHLPTRYEFIDSLSLPLNGTSAYFSLRQCFRDYMSSELVHEVECPSCSRNADTKCKKSFVKQVRIGRPPEVLCLSIIRSTWLPDGSLTKNTAHIQFPFSLDISEFLTSTCDTNLHKVYQLKAVVEHFGGPSSGHYCTYRQFRRQWIYTSDTTVYPIHTNEVMNCEAYLLFYQRA